MRAAPLEEQEEDNDRWQDRSRRDPYDRRDAYDRRRDSYGGHDDRRDDRGDRRDPYARRGDRRPREKTVKGRGNIVRILLLFGSIFCLFCCNIVTRNFFVRMKFALSEFCCCSKFIFLILFS